MSLASRAVREAAAIEETCGHLSEHNLEAEEIVHTDDTTQEHGGRTEAAIAENNSWERALRGAATR